MRILFISHDDGKYGAAQSLMKMIAIQKNKNYITPIVVTRKYNEVNKFCNEQSIENYVLPYVNCITFNFRNRYKLFLYKLKQLCKNSICNKICEKILIRKINISEIDAIYTNVSTIDFGAKFAEKYDIPHFWHIREFGEKDINAVPVSKNYYKLMNKSKKVFAISNIIMDEWIRKGIDDKKIIRIYNGLDSNEFKYEHIPNKEDYIKIIFIGSSAPHKGVNQVIRAIEILKGKNIENLLVDIYGDYTNEYGKKVINDVLEKNLDNIIFFKGFCSNIKEKLNEYNIGLVCSKSEAFGRVTIEYMLSGVAVIASDTGANVEIINNNNGILYKYSNYNDLAKKIKYLIDDKELMKEYSKNAYVNALEKFDAYKNAELIYEQINDNI